VSYESALKLSKEYLRERYLLHPESEYGPRFPVPILKTVSLPLESTSIDVLFSTWPFLTNSKDSNTVYPRESQVYSKVNREYFQSENSILKPHRLVNQRNLKKESKIVLYRPKTMRKKHSTDSDFTTTDSKNSET
jgi:hypothetical protein